MNSFQQQFVVYGGYYYVLTLIFLGAGVYKLTHTGWRESFREFWKESIPEKKSEPSSDYFSDEHLGTIQTEDVEKDEESTTKPV